MGSFLIRLPRRGPVQHHQRVRPPPLPFPFLDLPLCVRFLSNELAQCARVAQDDPAAGEGADLRSLLSRLNALVPLITPTDPVLLRLALSYSDLRDQSLFVLEDGSLGGIAGLEATVLPACLAASWPVFLRRDGVHSKQYRPAEDSVRSPTLPDTEVVQLRDVFLETAKRACPAYALALQKGEKLRQMLEFMKIGNWEGLRKWEGDVRRELAAR